MRESSIGINIFGVPDSLDISGVAQCINHKLKLSQEYLINKKIILFERTDEPIPHQNFSFRQHNEARMPPEAFAELKFSNLKMYDDKVGCRLLTVHASPKDWRILAPLYQHLETSGGIKRLFRRGVVHEVLNGKAEISEIIAIQKSKTAHLKYGFRLMFESHPEIAVLDKRVEIRYTNGQRPEKKYSTLRRFYMNLENPETGKPLIEAILVNPNRAGTS